MNGLHWRIAELEHHASDIVWLDAAEALSAYALVGLYDSKVHLGLNTTTAGSVERLEFGDDVQTATEWLRARMSNPQEVVVVFGDDDCFRCSSVFFLENWPDIFVPSRDDAMVYSIENPLIVFYCHENEFEVGQRLIFD